jgi:dolichol-phosphate mannosyltransferase
LVSAISNGISSSSADCILVMDADFSHPPEMISKIFDELKSSNANILIASRYTKGGSIKGWPLKRRLISKGALKLAQHFLNLKSIKDPMSGFFAFKRHVIENIKINTTGYKILLEVLVKANSKNKNNKDAITVKEIPYTFIDRQNGESKLGHGEILDYVKSVNSLSKYKKQNQIYQQRSKAAIKQKSFFSLLSQASKFLVVGASGLLINYLTCYLLSNGTMSSMWYVKATLIGILISMTSNFLLNKIWTFNDKNFSIGHTLKQYGLFAAISSFGAAIQLGLVYFLVQSGNFSYDFALISAVGIASISNFVLNKKSTFKKETIFNPIQSSNEELKAAYIK